MKNLKLISGLVVLALVIGLAGCKSGSKTSGDTKTNSMSKLENELDSVSYALGVNMATNVMRNGMKEVNPDKVREAVAAVFAGDTLLMDDSESGRYLNEYFENLMKQPGEDFLKANATKEGVTTLPSGMQYKVLKSGSGASPSLTDKVTTHYHGTFIDGKVFDSSFDRGQPATFPVNGVIKGWTEALQLMKEGDEWELYIPYDLAYGARGNQGIPPYSTLVFRVQLISVNK